MSEEENTGERFTRFHALYGQVVKNEFDPLEFAEDDFYAFQVLDRAFRCDNQELRNLAAHLQTQREAALETITLRATEILESTKRLKTLELKVLEQRGDSGDLAVPVPVPIPVPLPGAADTVAETRPPVVETKPEKPMGKPRRPAARPGRKGWFR